MNKIISHQLTIPDDCIDQRLDHALATLLPDYSRTLIKQWIDNGDVLLNEKVCKAKTKLHGGEKIIISTELKKHEESWEAEEIDLDIVFEDEHLIVVNKPSNLVVHPAAGNPDGTLVNALLHHAPELESLPRAGIIHRLDKDTTGLLLVAKSLKAHTSLIKQMQERNIKRQYCAIVHGFPIGGKTIDAPIGRHPRNRVMMAVVKDGKHAITHYRVAEKFKHFAKLTVQLETGRTHQIRVHLAHDGYPIVCDPLYGKKSFLSLHEDLLSALKNLKHQALHAETLACTHPETNQAIEWHSPLPEKMQTIVSQLQEHDAT